MKMKKMKRGLEKGPPAKKSLRRFPNGTVVRERDSVEVGTELCRFSFLRHQEEKEQKNNRCEANAGPVNRLHTRPGELSEKIEDRFGERVFNRFVFLETLHCRTHPGGEGA